MLNKSVYKINLAMYMCRIIGV